MGPGRCAETTQGGMVGEKEGCRVPGRRGVGATRAGLVRHPPEKPSASGTAGGGAHAHTHAAQSPARPRSALRLQPPSCSGCTLTLHLHSPQTHGHTRTPRGRRAGPWYPRGPRTRVHTLAYAHPDRGATTQRQPSRHTAHQPPTPTASRVFTPTPWSVTGGWTRGRTIPGGAHEGEVAPRPDGHPLRALPRSAVRTPSRARPPRTYCWPRCGCGCGPGSRTASPVPAGPRRRQRQQGRSGRPPGLGPPPAARSPPPPAFNPSSAAPPLPASPPAAPNLLHPSALIPAGPGR